MKSQVKSAQVFGYQVRWCQVLSGHGNPNKIMSVHCGPKKDRYKKYLYQYKTIDHLPGKTLFEMT